MYLNVDINLILLLVLLRFGLLKYNLIHPILLFICIQVKELGYFTHACQDDLVCRCTLDDIPYFNAPIYLENKQQIGKVDEIFGSIKEYSVSVKLSEDVKAKSFTPNQKVKMGFIVIQFLVF